jgi:Spy/CpxP family protein refolding chaperone
MRPAGLLLPLLVIAAVAALPADGPAQALKMDRESAFLFGLAAASQLDDGLGLLGRGEVQEELELTDGQKAELEELVERFREESRFPALELIQLTAEERRAKLAEYGAERMALMEEVRAKALEMLTPEQRERLDQIKLQLGGVFGLTDPEVLSELGITAEQQEQIEALAQEIGGKVRTLWASMRDVREAGREEHEAKEAEIREEARRLADQAVQQATGVLTPEQREKFDEMKGEEFELDRKRMFPRLPERGLWRWPRRAPAGER